MIEFLFLDLDDTILDFRKAESIALAKSIREFGIEPTEEVLSRYHVINKWHWEQLELGTMTREEVLVGRFGMLFSELSTVLRHFFAAVNAVLTWSVVTTIKHFVWAEDSLSETTCNT